MRLGWLIAISLCLSAPMPCAADEPDTTSAPSSVAPRQVGLRVAAGAGVGTRAFSLPTPQGVQQLADSPFAAAEFALAIRIWPTARLGLDVLTNYQTSIAWLLEQQPLFGLPQAINARSQRIELSVAPVWRLGSSPTAAKLSIPIGFGVRSFWPRPKQFPVRDYYFGGPQLRVQLELHVMRRVSLRLAPEVQWLVLDSPALLARGVSPGNGLAVGGEAALEADIEGALCLALSYRQSQAYAPSRSYALQDTERYLTVRIIGEL